MDKIDAIVYGCYLISLCAILIAIGSQRNANIAKAKSLRVKRLKQRYVSEFERNLRTSTRDWK